MLLKLEIGAGLMGHLVRMQTLPYLTCSVTEQIRHAEIGKRLACEQTLWVVSEEQETETVW